MKKTYIKPFTQAIIIETTRILCLSDSDLIPPAEFSGLFGQVPSVNASDENHMI